MARTFSGTGQYLSLASGLGFSESGTYWVSLWFKLGSTSAAQVLFSLGVSGSANNRRDIIWNTTSGGQIQVRSINNGGTTQSAVTAYSTTGTWAHVVGEWDSTSLRAVTVNNGTRVTNTNANGLGVAPDQVRVAASHAATSLFTGTIAHTTIYSGSPTSSDIASLYAGFHGRMVRPSVLSDHWDLGVDSPEPGIRGNALTLTGSPTVADDPVIYRPSGRSFVFMGTGGAPPPPSDYRRIAIGIWT